MSLHIYDRLAYISRIIDGLPPWNTLAFEDIYEAWHLADFFKNMITRGHLLIQYPNTTYSSFNTGNDNRHVALALSTYISSTFHANDIPITIRSPHESRGEFIALFNRLPNGTYTYTRENGDLVHLRFDPSKPSQFVKLDSGANSNNIWESFTNKLAGKMKHER